VRSALFLREDFVMKPHLTHEKFRARTRDAPPFFVPSGGWEEVEVYRNTRAKCLRYIALITVVAAGFCGWRSYAVFEAAFSVWLTYAIAGICLGGLSIVILVLAYRSPWVKAGSRKMLKEVRKGCDPHNLY
jgi:hypothetical protein